MERLFLECTIRAVLLVAGAAILLCALRVKDAATKHKVWTGVMLVMLALPAWTAWGPKASLHLLPPVTQKPSVVMAPPVIHEAAPDFSQFDLNLPPAPVKQSSSWDWQVVWIGIYLLGAAAMLIRLARGIFRTHLLVQCASLLDEKLTSASCVVPVATGWFRPKVILPAEWREWPQAKLDAVLTHEGEHARRRDPLIQGLALINRAVFWFHPAAWWLENKLSALAEEACDDVVLARGHSAREYSEYLMDMARAVMQSQARVNIAGLAMPGSSLPGRIKRIVTGVQASSLSRRRMALLTAACIISCAAFAGANIVHATLRHSIVSPQQSTTAVPPLFGNIPALDSISIRINKDGQAAPGGLDGKGTIWKNASLGLLIVSAYQLPESQFLGLPDWTDSEHFDVVSGEKPELDGEQIKSLTQTLLSDRFKLTMHHETRQLPHYELVAASTGKLGLNIRVNKDSCDPQAGIDTPAFRACGSLSLHHTPSTVVYEASGVTVQQFLAGLAGFGSNEKRDDWGLNRNIDRPVVDRTRLTDKFDLTLEFAPGWPGFDVITGPKAPPSLSKALEEQLGLTLVPRTGPVDVVVIDHVELPLEDASPQAIAQGASSGPFVESIQFDGNRRIPSEELATRIFTRIGDRFSEEAIQHDLTALRNSHYFEIVGFEAKRTPGRANATIVIFHLTEKPDANPQSTNASNLRYDAGSIKIVTPDPNGRGNIGWVGPGPFSAKNASLRNLLASSYQLTPAESQIISGGPEWMDSVRFDIEATSSTDPGEEQKRVMEQSLLANQFKLVTHWERQVLPVYSLELVEPGEWGPKLAPHSETAKCIVRTPGTKAPQIAPIGEPVPAVCNGTINIINKKLAERSGNNVTMAQVAAILSGDVERPVIDATRLGGEFDYELSVDFSARQAFAPFGNAVPSPNHDLAVKDPSLLFEIVRDQLGLKLVPTNGPVDVLVIDHVEMPQEGSF